MCGWVHKLGTKKQKHNGHIVFIRMSMPSVKLAMLVPKVNGSNVSLMRAPSKKRLVLKGLPW